MTVDVERTLGAGVRVRSGSREQIERDVVRELLAQEPAATAQAETLTERTLELKRSVLEGQDENALALDRREPHCPDMLIHRIELTNFKSFASAIIEMAPGLTAIVGDNGAGKTAILQAIGLGAFDARPRPARERRCDMARRMPR